VRRAAALAGLLVLTWGAASAHAARTTRVFAVGPKFSLDWVDTRAHFRDKLLALVDRRRRTPGAPAIQRGAGDVASHLRADGRNLVVLPEDVGLPAAFVGSRGAAARRTPPSDQAVVQAVVALLGPYAGPMAYYARRYPDLAGRGLPVRQLDLALTDTFARTAVETFATLARRYHVWLVAGVDMARSWRIVCTDRAGFTPPPGATRCDREDPAAVAALRDPDDPGRDYAYEATTPDPVNMALVFDPRGHLVSKQVKAYLTPVELPGGLDLVPGNVDGLRPVRTPVGALGIVTSKDAWMPDVVDKLDQRGANLLVQPEFFVGDTLRPHGQWAADTLKAALWSDVLRHPGLRSGVLASLTGNLFSFSADAQSHLVVKPRGPDAPTGRLAGQTRAPGFAAVQPYAIAQRPGRRTVQRRRRLGRAALRMLPTGPPCPSPRRAGACRDGMQEGTTWADVPVAGGVRRHRRPRPRPHGSPFTAARRIAPCACRQRNVDLATRGRLVAAAWEERRGGDRIALALSHDGGRTWTRVRRPGGRAPHQWWPQVAIGPDRRVWLSWQAGGPPHVFYATAKRGGRFARPRRLAAAPAPQWRPAIAATGPGRAVAAWVDERARSADDDKPQGHLLSTTLTPHRAGSAQRVDTGTPVAEAEKLDHAWAPDLAARGRRALLTWIDFHTYDWRVWSRASRDGGATWAPERAVTDTAAGREALDDAPGAALGPSGPLVTWTDYRNRATLAPNPLYDVMAARPGAVNIPVGDPRRIQVDAVAPAVATFGRRFAIAWEDHATGPGRILLAGTDARGHPGGVTGYALDAGPRATWNAWRPALAALPRRGLVAAWEDDHDGRRQVVAAIDR
jgi:predicted amidohydrolase